MVDLHPYPVLTGSENKNLRVQERVGREGLRPFYVCRGSGIPYRLGVLITSDPEV